MPISCLLVLYFKYGMSMRQPTQNCFKGYQQPSIKCSRSCLRALSSSDNFVTLSGYSREYWQHFENYKYFTNGCQYPLIVVLNTVGYGAAKRVYFKYIYIPSNQVEATNISSNHQRFFSNKDSSNSTRSPFRCRERVPLKVPKREIFDGVFFA